MAELETGGEDGDSVQVAVRMRIFNGREKSSGATRIVRMANMDKGSKTWIKDPDTGEEREYKYDFSFQSHSKDEPGIGEYATQDTVMQTLGIPVLNAALEGRNVSLFAYGQTGAGKSFSMLGKVGVFELEGIIPRTCKEIFKRMEDCTPLQTVTVDIQVVEVYCEMVNDLLADRKVWPAAGHKPRLTPKFGYVVDTTLKPCFKVDEIWDCMEFADKNRSVGSHALNPESSRAHTIYQINYGKITKNEGGKVMETLTAKLNLIDLAGSERTDSAGTSGQMLKEGNAINLSLTALGGCIKALSEGKKPNFRDSKLTLLLQASMTSGKVIMIAALSPASICYPESLSTLKFADRIKQVKIKSAKNVSTDPVAEMKKAMEALREKMQSEIDALRAGGATIAEGGGGDDSALKGLLEEKKAAEEAMKKDLMARIAELSGDGSERKARANEINEAQQAALAGISNVKSEDETRPHFVNLHEDDRLSESLVYPFDVGDTVIGRMDKANPPKVLFNGMGIVKQHCTITVTTDDPPQVFLTPGGARAKCLLNGKKMTAKTELIHQNRVWLGNNYALRFHFPGQEARGEGREENPDYFVAESEVAEEMEKMSLPGAGGGGGGGDAETTLTADLRHKLAEAERKIDQANIIATDLDQEVIFTPKLYENRATKETDVVVAVNMGGFSTLTWPWSKFNVRLVEMVKMWTEWQTAESRGEEWKAPELGDEDPFVDRESQLIGEADVWLHALANMVEFAAQTSVLSCFGNVEGKLLVELQPCDKNGRPGPFDDEEDEDLDPFVDEPEELLDEEIQWEVRIPSVALEMGGGACKYEKTFVRYKFNMDDEEEGWHTTREEALATYNPKYNFVEKHKVKVDQDILKHITTGKMTFQLWGTLCAQQNNEGQGIASKLEAKRKEVSKLEQQLAQKDRVLQQKEQLIIEKKKQLSGEGGGEGGGEAAAEDSPPAE
eukprot:NODE_52_length_3030_cov_247.387530_g50_i0.p1 GENE.NODE_52_length_3030_cov_247.387530_g50_i0~~NODE_52_length_3030_cov_247.387530_g50_i0.p1  ORF type:complete len:980 (-),score=299.05 NODE_52_length_3030_cov_247.387530_g50_i0:89-2950(-)